MYNIDSEGRITKILGMKLFMRSIWSYVNVKVTFIC